MSEWRSGKRRPEVGSRWFERRGLMSIEEIIESWRRSRAISPCITDLRISKKREGQYRPFPDFLHPLLREALERDGIQLLYSHQAEAVEAIQNGKDVVVVTPTASGKTLCYNLPVLNSRLNIPSSKALYLFPTVWTRNFH
jgi:DEAD/DEAH box helicase domain-containing protein